MLNPWNWAFKWLYATLGVLGTETCSSVRATNDAEPPPSLCCPFLVFSLFPLSFFLFSFPPETGSHRIDQAGLGLTEIVLPFLHECWDERCVPPRRAPLNVLTPVAGWHPWFSRSN